MFLLLPIFCCYFFLIYLFVTAKAALPKTSLMFAARQIANNLSQKAKKFTSFFGFRIISLERTSNNLAFALQRFLCLCNVCVKRTRPNAVDRLGCTTYRAALRVDLLIHTCGFTSTCGYVGADATSSPSHYAGDGSPSSPTSAWESVYHSNVLACSPF